MLSSYGWRTALGNVCGCCILALFASCGSGGSTAAGADSKDNKDVSSNSEVTDKDGSGKDLIGADKVAPDATDIDTDGDIGVDLKDDEVETFPICAGPGEFLCDCEDNTDCVSGYCVTSPQGKVCTMTCIEDCPDGWDCKQDATAFPDPVYICLPRDVYLCRPCNTHDNCRSPYSDANDLCVPHGDTGSFCGIDCSGSGICPSGFLCGEVQTEGVGLVQQCVPEGGECECQPLFTDQGATTHCQQSNSNGVCTGERGCGSDGLTECSAQVPKPEECNEIDDNCDGIIDPPGSLQCITYYLDNDGDGYGLGIGDCVCGGPPSNKHVPAGGDCDDSNVSKHPGANEVCNHVDDDCDGDIDEPNSVGCKTMYYDGDLDGYGVSDNVLCLCEPAMGYVEVGNDCDDTDPDITGSDSPEVCDGVDNNCNGVIDEENAQGCLPLYLDQDEDGFGISEQLKCLCNSVGFFTANKGGDCNDTNPAIHPTAVEECDGIDNDCDGAVDEGEAVNGCGVVAHGDVVCEQGVGCVVTECDPGFIDLNLAFVDGCECEIEPGEIPSQLCSEATDKGELVDTGAGQATFTGRIVPSGDEDWFKFRALDGLDPLGCDTFHICVRFTKNPNHAYLFDVYMGGCSGNDNLCVQSTEFSYFTDFHLSTPEGAADVVGGECPCAADADQSATPLDKTDDTSETAHQCSSQTNWYYVRVYRKPGMALICDEYQLQVTNGATNVTCGTEEEDFELEFGTGQ